MSSFFLFSCILFAQAFVLALNELNTRSDSDVFISALLFDSCSDYLAEHVRTVDNYHQSDQSDLVLKPIRALDHAISMIAEENRQGEKNTIIGVVGASYSSVTIPFSRATLDRKLPLISYASTNPVLSQYQATFSPGQFQSFSLLSPWSRCSPEPSGVTTYWPRPSLTSSSTSN